MNLETSQLETIRRYLLGLVPEEEAATLGERLVTDKEFYEELLIVESELIDDYLSDELSPAEREKFESHFLIARERRDQLRFARSFHGYLSEQAPELETEALVEEPSDRTQEVDPPPPKPWYSSFLPVRNPAFAYSFMAALVLIVAVISWYALRNAGPTDPGKVYVAELTPGGPTRSGGEAKKISLPPGTGTLELRLAADGEAYGSYRAVLVGDSGSEVWSGDNLQSSSTAGTRIVTVNIPVRSIPPGLYRLRLSGQTADNRYEDLLTYYFRIQP